MDTRFVERPDNLDKNSFPSYLLHSAEHCTSDFSKQFLFPLEVQEIGILLHCLERENSNLPIYSCTEVSTDLQVSER